jgi:uncharacterized protein
VVALGGGKMTKKILSVILVLILCLSLPIVVSGEEYSRIFVEDGALLLTDSKELELTQRLEQISQKYGAQVMVITTNNVYGGNIDAYVEHVYDSNFYGYGEDRAGVLLLVSMDLREYRILSNGFAGDAIDKNDIDSISDLISSYLSDGDYATAFSLYADECEYYLDGHINGFPFDFSGSLITALVVGFIVAIITVSVMKGKLRSVRRQNEARQYVKEGSMQLTQSGDYFMYRNVTRTPKPQNNSSSRSGGGGGSRSIGGGKF